MRKPPCQNGKIRYNNIKTNFTEGDPLRGEGTLDSSCVDRRMDMPEGLEGLCVVAAMFAVFFAWAAVHWVRGGREGGQPSEAAEPSEAEQP